MAGYKLASITSQEETDNLLQYIKEEGKTARNLNYIFINKLEINKL